MNIGTYLRNARIERGLTQAQAATKLGYGSPQYISNIERGACVVPKGLVRQMAKLYRMNKAELVRTVVRIERDKWMEALK